MDTVILVLVFATLLVLAIIITNHYARLKYEHLFRLWREDEEADFQSRMAQVTKGAVTQSRAILGGKFTEQMAPFLPEFRYDPTEARFIGSPVDFLVFPGLASGEPREVVILEIKSGKAAALTPAQRKICKLIEDGMVRWEVIQKNYEESE
ncbi:Holliday junction resolvase-like protein [Chloroflexota bacterium]